LRKVNGQLHSFTFIINENNMLHLRQHLFQEFLFIFLPDTNIIMTLL